MKVAKNKVIERKVDTRKKIMLGGLSVKAKFDHFYPHNPAISYGMLLYLKRAFKTKTGNCRKVEKNR